MKNLLLLALVLFSAFAFSGTVFGVSESKCDSIVGKNDSIDSVSGFEYVVIDRDSATRYTQLTDSDYIRVAAELEIEPAVLHAVVDIEAGKEHRGFASPGVPVINFDKSIFTRFLRKKGISVRKHISSEAFGSVNVRKYGNYSKAQFARLEAGRKIDKDLANMATFWGMFQIGGFNWKKCGASSIDEFVFQMSYSEEMQLELFARFVKNSGMLPALKAKNWRSFAKAYNGPRYASRGYHVRLANAYAKYAK